MPRGPQQRCPLFLGTWSAPYTPVAGARAIANPASSTLTWVANLAVYVPVTLPAPFPVQRLWWYNGSTVTGNVDMGIYSKGGSLIASAGTTAQSGSAVPQYVAKAVLLPPGGYYFALVCSGTTAAIQGHATWTAANLNLIGVLQQALGSALLPATMSPAAMANALFPYCGITQTPSGF